MAIEWLDEIERRAPRPITAEDLERMMRELQDIQAERASTAVMVLSPRLFDTILYHVQSVVLWQLPGYERRRGPDGRTWISNRIPAYERNGERIGGGHKAKRRIGMEPDDLWPWERLRRR